MQKCRVLLVEDNAIAQMGAQCKLEEAGFSVDIAGDGKTALEHFKSNQYGLILMDIGLPDRDGFEVAQKIRAIEKNSSKNPVVIVALTSHEEASYEGKSKDSGMNGFLRKPLEVKKLLEFIS